MIPMALGWDQQNAAAITVALIASSAGMKESLSKGLLRVIGTVVGATIGVLLVAIYPQERVLYLLLLSLVLMVVFYLYYAYRGDNSIFMLTAMTLMTILLNAPENAFLNAVDKTLMTIFAIALYTLIGVFIWPIKKEKEEQSEFPTNSSSTSKSSFIFLDPDNFKATFQIITIFWITTLFWIYFNPPGGFLLVTLATVLGLFTTFSSIKASSLMVLFTLGLFISTLTYIFVLPNLVYGWELALFIFIYAFVGFYFVPEKIVIFFLIGLFIAGINNTMQYNFAIYLNMLLVFYLFLIILMILQNFPFSAKPEHLLLNLKNRYFRYVRSYNKTASLSKKKHLKVHLEQTIAKMKFSISQLDMDYFSDISHEELMLFLKQCEESLQAANDVCINNVSQNIDWAKLKLNRF